MLLQFHSKSRTDPFPTDSVGNLNESFHHLHDIDINPDVCSPGQRLSRILLLTFSNPTIQQSGTQTLKVSDEKIPQQYKVQMNERIIFDHFLV